MVMHGTETRRNYTPKAPDMTERGGDHNSLVLPQDRIHGSMDEMEETYKSSERIKLTIGTGKGGCP
jgi:hypothetical protein